MQKYAIIVAGGSGKRMGTDVPKQFLEIGKKPVLMHTIDKFKIVYSEIQIIVVLPQEQHNYWNELCKKHNFNTIHTICSGGKERFHSVKNGLAKVKNKNSLVAIHDGVRPLVSKKTIVNCFEKAKETGAVIPVIKPSESLRIVEDGTNKAVDRSKYYLVQTPQVFTYKKIITSYNTDYQSFFTDDASVVEYAGNSIYLVEGNSENIKITHPSDLKIAEIFIG